jgi:RND family efflux transporter MFP subunit
MTSLDSKDNRSLLLQQLHIDRDEAPAAGRARPYLTITVAAIAGAGVSAVAVWLLLPRAPASPVEPSAPAPALALAATPAEVGPQSSAVSAILDASGYVVARRQATVSAKITGKVIEVMIEEGQRVEAGQIVARLDDANARAETRHAEALLEQQRAALAAANIALQNAEPGYMRQREQFLGGFISEQALDNEKSVYDSARAAVDVAERGVEVAEANVAVAQRGLDDTVVRAPFAGIVTVKAAQQGEVVSPMSAGEFTRTGICTIVDMDSLEVEVDVSENFINRVQTGAQVVITSNAYPEDQLDGHVIAIIPTADRAKATVTVRVGFDQRDTRILPEMGARVTFLAPDANGSSHETGPAALSSSDNDHER